jgi:glycosyltransferase involved in cell wall biosynthesis
MKPLSVVQVSSGGGRGGAETVLVHLAKSLQTIGVESAVVFLGDGPMVEEAVRMGIQTEVIGLASKYDFSAIHRLYTYFRRCRFDVVHTHARRAMLMGNLAARLSRVPVVVTTLHGLSGIHGGGETAGDAHILQRLYPSIEGMLGRWCTDACVGWSERVRTDSIRARGLQPERVAVIHNGINLDESHPVGDSTRRTDMRRHMGLEPDDFVVGTVGRLVAVKGQIHLVAAMPHIARELPRARLLIVGAGPMRDELENAASRWGVRERVLFAGDLRADSDVHSCFDVFVYPSVDGVFGLVVQEAMACGVPVVVSGLEGTDELIKHEENGLLVPPGDERAIAEAVLLVSRNPGLRRRLIDSGRATIAREFTDAGMARQYRSLYESLLGDRVDANR